VSNYRVRQVLALGEMPMRQLRFLVALATWLPDDSRSVRVGFGVLVDQTGNVRNTARKARRELEDSKRLSSVAGNGAGHLTLWTALCLPEKGVSDVDPLPADEKGINGPQQRGSTGPGKGGQGQPADLPEPDRGLDRLANPSGSGSLPLGQLLAAAVPGATEREIEGAITTIENRHVRGEIRNERGYLRSVIDRGDAAALIEATRAELLADARSMATLAQADYAIDTHQLPPCPHGMPGGASANGSGALRCPHCRRALTAWPDL
jgi:hypothetical protein